MSLKACNWICSQIFFCDGDVGGVEPGHAKRFDLVVGGPAEPALLPLPRSGIGLPGLDDGQTRPCGAEAVPAALSGGSMLGAPRHQRAPVHRLKSTFRPTFLKKLLVTWANCASAGWSVGDIRMIFSPW